jgi:hypothetical protein
MGGSQPAQKAFMIAKATIWPIVDSGRIATNYLGEENRVRQRDPKV